MSLAQKLARLADIFCGNQNGYGIPLSNRNYFVDGNFDLWNANSAAVSASNAYSPAIMYRGGCGTAGAATAAIGTFSGTEPVGMSSPAVNYYSHQQTTASTGTVALRTAPAIMQYIENALTLQGRTATFSVWLWCASGTQTISNIIFAQQFGSGGSAAVVLDTAVNWTVTTTPQRFSVSVAIPSVAGKTFGTSHYLQVGLYLPSGATYTINTCQWQFEQSSPQAGALGAPTAFEYRGQQAEWARAQRYWFSYNAAWTQVGSGSLTQFVTLPFKQTMRATPSMAFTNYVDNDSSGFTLSTVTADTNGIYELLQSGSTAGKRFTATFVADSRQ